MNLALLCRISECVWTSSLSLVTLVSYSKVQRGWHFFSSIEVWHKMHLCLLKCWWFVYHSRRPLFLPPSLIPWLYLYQDFFFPKNWENMTKHINQWILLFSQSDGCFGLFGCFYLKRYFLPSGQLNSFSLYIRNLRHIDEFENKWLPIFTIIFVFNQ